MSKTNFIRIFIILMIMYVALGLPDGVLGAAWPQISSSLTLNIALVAVISNANLVVSFISSLLYPLAIKRYSFITIFIFSLTMTVISLLFFAASQNLFMLICAAMILGLGGGLIDSAVNDYASRNFKVAAVNILHGTWGIGISLGSFIVAATFINSDKWQIAYIIVAIIQFLILIIIYFNKNIFTSTKEEVNHQTNYERLPKKAIFNSIYYFFYGIEYVFVLLISTYGINEQGFSNEQAAFLTTSFLIGITVGRFLVIVIANYLSTKNIIRTSIILVIIFALLAMLTNLIFIFVFLIGVVMGPLYPSMMSYSSEVYSNNILSRVISINVSSALLGVIFIPLFYSFLFNIISYAYLFYALIFSMLILYICLHFIASKKKC